MLGIEIFPTLLYFQALFFIPISPRWLATKKNCVEAKQVLSQIHGKKDVREKYQSKKKELIMKKN